LSSFGEGVGECERVQKKGVSTGPEVALIWMGELASSGAGVLLLPPGH
jgi:hypothetical protein